MENIPKESFYEDNGLLTRKIKEGEHLPYDLLLLADETIDAINRYISHSQIYLYEKEGVVIGEYVLQPISLEEIEIKNIAVRTAYQGQGIGHFLLADASRRAKEQGFNNLIIGTGDVMFKQLYLYQKCGYEMFDIKKNFYLTHYPIPLYENGLQLKHMVMLKKKLV